MRVYGIADLDGLVEAKVAAPSVDDAARALGISLRHLRERGWRPIKGAAATAARKRPGEVLYRAMGTDDGWTGSASAARAKAARRVKRAQLV